MGLRGEPGSMVPAVTFSRGMGPAPYLLCGERGSIVVISLVNNHCRRWWVAGRTFVGSLEERRGPPVTLLGCVTKHPGLGDSNQAVLVLEARSPRSRHQQGHEASRKALSQASQASGSSLWHHNSADPGRLVGLNSFCTLDFSSFLLTTERLGVQSSSSLPLHPRPIV